MLVEPLKVGSCVGSILCWSMWEKLSYIAWDTWMLTLGLKLVVLANWILCLYYCVLLRAKLLISCCNLKSLFSDALRVTYFLTCKIGVGEGAFNCLFVLKVDMVCTIYTRKNHHNEKVFQGLRWWLNRTFLWNSA